MSWAQIPVLQRDFCYDSFSSPFISYFSWMTLHWCWIAYCWGPPKKEKLPRQRLYLRSSKFFFLSVSHVFMSPPFVFMITMMQNISPNLWTMPMFLIPNAPRHCLASASDWLLFWIQWSKKRQVINVPGRPILSHDETYVLMMLFTYLFITMSVVDITVSLSSGSGKLETWPSG